MLVFMWMHHIADTCEGMRPQLIQGQKQSVFPQLTTLCLEMLHPLYPRRAIRALPRACGIRFRRNPLALNSSRSRCFRGRAVNRYRRGYLLAKRSQYLLHNTQLILRVSLMSIFTWKTLAERTVVASSAPRVDDGPPAPSTPSTRATEHQRSSSGHWNLTQLDNAWDDVPGISRYVVSLQKHRRVKSLDPQPAEVASPLAETPPSGPSAPSAGLKLTDFPTEVERPSLPVTPAPVGRSSFWGKDDTKVGEAGNKEILPAAEGVPLQSEWVCAHGARWGG